MGQQQLILLVLATVIVGLATVVGIRAFSENSVKSNADAMMQDAVRIANDLQAWKQKPAPFGGQGSVTPASVDSPSDFTGANFTLLGYKEDATTNEYENLNGSFTLTTDGSSGAASITGTSNQQDNTVVVEVCGLSDRNVAGAITVLGGETTGQTPTCTPPA